jgi:hypothetical protein
MKKRGVTKRKLRGGYYEFKGGIAPGAPSWGAGSEMGPYHVDKMGNMGQYGRGRKLRRKGKKGTRRRRKTMRGGSKYGAVSATFAGQGHRGMANYAGTHTKYPPFGGPEHGAFNNAGAGPGNFKSFGGLFPK